MKTAPLLVLMMIVASCGSTVSSPPEGKDGGAQAPSVDGARSDARSVTRDAAPDVRSVLRDAARDAHLQPADAAGEAASADASLSLMTNCNGLTGQAVLDALRPRYSATYTPAGSGKPTPLTISTQYKGGKVSCRATPCDECPPGGVDVEVQIDFVTADGAFNETFTTPVELSFGSSGNDTLSWDPVVPATAIKGTYKASLGGGSVNLSFGGSFTGATTSGLVEQQGTHMVAGAGNWM